MTTREYFNAVLAYVDGDQSDEGVALFNKSVELIGSLDAKNAKRSSADSKSKQETSARRNAVLAFLTANCGQWFNRDEIADGIGNGITVTQITSACSSLAKSGEISKMEAKVGKTRKTVYSITKEEEDEVESED